MAKKDILNLLGTVGDAYQEALNKYRLKYYNLFCEQFKWTGLNYRQVAFLNRKFYYDGTIGAFKINLVNELGFAPWVEQTWDIYDQAETVRLINTKNSILIPRGDMIVDKDVVIGYIQPNRKPVASIVDWYLKRIVQVEMVINTNLELHKLPFIIPVEDGKDLAKLKDVVDRILSNQLVIFAEGVDPKAFNAVATGAPFIIDKLSDYKSGLINELNTYLGINNSGRVQKQEQVNIDELNANNDEVNDSNNQFIRCLTEFTDQINKVLGVQIKVESTSKPVTAVGEFHNIADDNKPGPNEGGANND